ncbi:MAG: N-acetylmuramoyl-L-alanine amidase [Solidesulfovibrio magneticus str. Maddingley MBC34]|uniref:N-acetylmuramoyl-L-alanine amidase n=1 Tax=Solidesulfovibrio magneticus str. Maddingley MBC34 TaxID=1206767 RepID=K6GS02_9BACT|nr:MAG: N-acetylmuramoyl-L-alanine amidase [Solidesulfovibrio magneticus str. Maddingley MBC34]
MAGTSVANRAWTALGVILALFLGLSLAPGQAGPALAAKSRAKVAAAAGESAYDKAVARFDALRKDPASAGRRDLWKELDADFAALAKTGGNTAQAAKALYYQAWTTAEMAKRSALDADYEAAASLYGKLAQSFPTHAWADDALLRRAVILAENLKRPLEAKADLETIVRKYRKGDMAAQAKKFLAAFGDAPAKPAEATKTAEPTKAVESAKAAEAAAAKPAVAPPPAKPAADLATPAKPAFLNKAEVVETPGGSRITLTLTRETAYRYQILDQKRSDGGAVKRLYIDLDNARTGPRLASEKRYKKGPVSRVRAGYFTPETVRVVLELESLSGYEIRSETGPFRVVLDVAGDKGRGVPEPARAEAPAKAAPPPAKETAAKSAAREVKAPATPPPLPSAPAANLRPPEKARKNAGSLLEQFGLTLRTVMIDAGHGGKDPGAQGLSGLTEKDVNLRFAKFLGEALQKKGINVIYTRTSDVFIPLETRTELANSKGADLFVSVHCNSHTDKSSAGMETYSLNLATTQEAVRVAARENAASQKKISDLQAILTDLMLSAKTAESRDLAKFVQKRSIAAVRGDYPTRDRGPHEAPFFVLIGANMPAVLVELGYVTNPEDAKRLTSDAYLRALAQGMTEGILAYKKRLERYANL